MALRTTPASRYRWNPTAQRYIDARGRFVAQAVLRKEIDGALASATIRVRTLAEQLRAGQITVEEWELAMRGMAKEVHLYNAAAARGGWAQLGDDDYGRVGRIVRDEYAWIRNFRTEIEDGYPLDGRFLRRVELYAQAGRETFHKVERQVQLEQGNTLERSILGAADHCEGEGSCVEQAARGWVLVGQLIAIGQRLCGRRCKCSIEYSSIGKLADAAKAPDGKTAPVVQKTEEPLPKEPAGPYRAKYASAVMDMDTCDHCARFDSVVVAIDDPRQIPDHACTAERGCHCQWVYIRKTEGTRV
jgi:hypothetical protein